MTESREITTVSVTDLLDIFDISPGSLIKAGVKALIAHRTLRARDIFTEELRNGEKLIQDLPDGDAAAAALYRYARAAQEGAARINLRLMAKCLTGMVHSGRLVADEFLAFADVLSTLRREEIILIAAVYRAQKMLLAAGVNVVELHKYVVTELVGQSPYFPTEDHLAAIAGATARSGLIVLQTGFGVGIEVRPSPLMTRLEKYLDIEAAIDAEPEESAL